MGHPSGRRVGQRTVVSFGIVGFFLGIDGGQSSTRVLIGDDHGRVIGWARGGPCNHVTAAEAAAKFQRVIASCVAEASLIAGLDSANPHFIAACCGMSGGPEDKAGLLAAILHADRLVVKTDGETALAGAMAGQAGIIVVAGTGSIAYGRDDSGRLVRAGGWGYVFGDEGGAFDIARQAIRAVLRFAEGWGPPTALQAALLEHTGARDANHLLHLCYTPAWPRSRVAAMSELIDRIAGQGDWIARALLEQAAQNLAALAGSVRGQLFPDSAAVRVAPIGGVFRSAIVGERFQLLVELTDGARCVPPLFDPVAGALLDSYRSAAFAVTLANVPDW